MTFAPRTWVVGEVVTAALLNQEIRDQINSLLAAWTAYTPSWLSSGTAPAIGNGTIVGRYMKVGRTVFLGIHWTAGSTTTYGSGNYTFSLPANSANAGLATIGVAQYVGTERWGGESLIISNTSSISIHFPQGATDTRLNTWTNARPETAAATHQMRITHTYEAAA
ncbi:hypothetical protein [Streptomyces sp. KR55]|uniref:hypothetical protein n=1 Tax=Streptomyces sp. KR55 TaxID=3457425 RepID=UPI003FD017EA